MTKNLLRRLYILPTHAYTSNKYSGTDYDFKGRITFACKCSDKGRFKDSAAKLLINVPSHRRICKKCLKALREAANG